MTATHTPERLAPPSQPSLSSRRAHAETHGIARRFAERFGLIAFGLYHLPLFLNNYPSLGGGGFNGDGLAPRWGHVFTPPAVWVARHVFHMTGPMPNAYQGDNGDVAEEYVRLLMAVVIALVGAVAWTAADRKRPAGVWVESAFRLLLRYSVALGLMSYAIAKIFPQQFPPIGATTLETRVGDLPPMALLWTFMEYSRAYAFFGGLMELVAAVLLCVRRTATLGALLCLAVMTNVALLNFAYGVPVKLYATMIAVSAAVLVSYDARRLLEFFAGNRAVPPAEQSTLVQDRIPARWRRAIKVVGVGSVTLSSIIAMAPTLRRSPVSPIDGAWIVTSSDAATPWRRLTVSPFGVAIRTAADTTIGCGRSPGADSASLTLRCPRGRVAALHWSRTRDTLHVDGTFGAAPVHVTATYVDPSSYPLLRSRFRWFFD
jgi:hypothetical protein